MSTARDISLEGKRGAEGARAAMPQSLRQKDCGVTEPWKRFL